MAGAAISYLNLAYLAEFSIVLNLAYRELKYPELHRNVVTKIRQTFDKASALEISENDVPELRQLGWMLDGCPAEHCKDFRLWHGSEKKQAHYEKFIRTRKSLDVVNNNILITVGLIIALTFLHFWVPNIASTFLINDPLSVEGTLLGIWWIVFVVLVYTTLRPLWFIHRGTEVQEFLLGDDLRDGKPEGAIVHAISKVNLAISQNEAENAAIEENAAGPESRR